VLIKLLDGSVVCGWIEYYDRRMVRLTREGEPNLFIFKHEIAYIAEDPARQPRSSKLPGVKSGNSTSASA
jgi:host factor-I protein